MGFFPRQRLPQTLEHPRHFSDGTKPPFEEARRDAFLHFLTPNLNPTMPAKKAKSLRIGDRTFRSIAQFSKFGRGCATPRPNRYQIVRNDERLQAAARARRRAIGAIAINVQFIHIVDGSTGVITAAQRRNQIRVLNEAFQAYGISFLHGEEQVKTADNESWFYMDHGSAAERQAKAALRASPERHLNFYTGGLVSGLLGWATFPWELEGDRDRDGVVILHSSLPGGDAAPYNLGKTAVHEVGHWLGLYHTFQGGCEGFGDHVGDTVPHDGPNEGKPEDGGRHGACDREQQAPIHNYMNYTDDEWLNQFTEGQIARIKEHVAEYRPGFIA